MPQTHKYYLFGKKKEAERETETERALGNQYRHGKSCMYLHEDVLLMNKLQGPL